MDIENPKYHLSQSLMFHNGAARTCHVHNDKMISGGIDRKVFFYQRTGDKQLFEQKAAYSFFTDYIMYVKIIDNDKFVVGCKDKNIYICSFEDNQGPMLILEGHEGPVNSVEVSGTSLVSGSWDATAKIWDLESGQCTKTLEGHSHAVTVFITSKRNIITGSQDGALHLWSIEGTKIKSVPAAHTNIIRAIVECPELGIFTCSNDSKVKLWSLDLDELSSFEDHTSFVFAVNYLNENSTDFVSGGEDFKAIIHFNGKNCQEILHPNTVWNIAVDRNLNKDLVTACGDG